MPRPGFRINHGGMQELLNGAVAEAACRPAAERVLAAAQAGAPVESGGYRASLRIEVGHSDRAQFRIVAGVSYAAAVEARTGNLVRALGAA